MDYAHVGSHRSHMASVPAHHRLAAVTPQEQRSWEIYARLRRRRVWWLEALDVGLVLVCASLLMLMTLLYLADASFA